MPKCPENSDMMTKIASENGVPTSDFVKPDLHLLK
jgi:hypothetical protein